LLEEVTVPASQITYAGIKLKCYG